MTAFSEPLQGVIPPMITPLTDRDTIDEAGTERLLNHVIDGGVAGVFMETHQDPDNAPSDGPNMIQLSNLENLLKQLIEIDNVIKK